MNIADLTALSKQNWEKIPVLVREGCLNELEIRTSPDIMALWVGQVRAGEPIGSDDMRFHFALGMQVRNALRQQLLDEELPGPPELRNWDDFYIGALHALVERAVAKGF